MSRRRMMMLQLAQADSNLLYLIEDYKLSWNSIYAIDSIWSGNTVTLRHTRSGSFAGAGSAYMSFIGTSKVAGQDTLRKLPSLPTLDSSKCYRLTLTVLNITTNTATDETSGVFRISTNVGDQHYVSSVNLCDIAVGTQIVLETSKAGAISGAAFGSNVPSTKWSFDFDVKLEEV